MESATIANIIDKKLVSVSSNASVKTALKLLEDSSTPLLPVIDEGKLVGILNRERLAEKANENTDIASIMGRPLFLESGASIDYAIKYMISHNIPRIPVVDSAIGMHCIGIVSSTELLKAKKSIQ